MESDLKDSNARQVYNCVRKIAPYESRPNPSASDDPKLPDELNEFYARFDRHPTEPSPEFPTTDKQSLVIDEADTRRAFKRLNVRKATGPDGISN